MDIFGVELDFDFFDADHIEAYERESKRVAEDIKEPTQYEGKSTADAIRIQCRIIDTFFDNVIGPGTAEKIFAGKNNLRYHMEAFGIMSQRAQNSNAELDSIMDKYSPNRAERRQAEQDARKFQKQGSRNFNRSAAGKGKKHNR